MTHIDPEAKSITARLEQLASKGAEKKQPLMDLRSHQLFGLGMALLTGIVLGIVGLQVATSLPTNAKNTPLSNQALDWIVYEIADGRNITPTLARRILEQQIGTKIGAH